MHFNQLLLVTFDFFTQHHGCLIVPSIDIFGDFRAGLPLRKAFQDILGELFHPLVFEVTQRQVEGDE